MDKDTYLNKINAKRKEIEAPFVFCLWKDPDLYDEYKFVNEKDENTLRTEDAQFYFYLGKGMYKAGYKQFDDISVYTFLQDKPDIKKKFDDYGGYHEVETLKNLVSEENVDAYFDKIAKINVLDSMCQMMFESFDN